MAAVGAEFWPHSHSEMSERIRRHDWGATALGTPDAWPASLRLLLDTILEAPLPMCILWGDQALQLYNDAHAALIGDRHPDELGQPACHPRSEEHTSELHSLMRNSYSVFLLTTTKPTQHTHMIEHQ